MRVSDARPSFLRWSAMGMGAVVALIGAGHMAAWFAGVMAERGVSALTMKTNAAFCLLLLGTSLLLLVPQRAGPLRSWASRVCAALALLIGAMSLSENVAGWDLGIDQLLAEEPPGALGVSAPNRMGTPGSVNFALAGMSLLLLAWGQGRGAWAARKLAGVVCLISLLSVMGHLYDVQTLYGVARFTAIAWPTAVTLLLLGLGILCARPDEGLAAQAMAPDAGGATLRWLLLPMVLVPVGLGWLRLAGERWGWFDAGMGTSLTMLIFIVTFTSVACLAARRGSKAATALRQSERRFRVAQEFSLDAFTILSAVRHTDGRIVDFRWEYVNPAAARLLRRTPENLIGHRLLQVLPGNKVNSDLFDHYVRVVETGEAHDYELPYESDGIQGWFRNMAVKLDDGIAVYFADITDRKRAEESLRRSEAMLARAQRMAKLGTWEWDVATSELSWSEEVYQIFGRVAGQFTPTYDVFPELIHPEDRGRVVAAVEGGLAGRPYNIEYRIMRPDSTIRHILAQGDVDFDAGGEPIRMMGTVVDVTDAKQAEKALRASEARYRILFDEMDEGYCIIEMLYDESGRPNDWRFIEVNPAFEKHNGLKDAAGRTIRELAPNMESRWFERYGEVARTGQAVRCEDFSEALDGRWFDLYVFRVGEPEQHRVAVLFTDITARKRAEEERGTALEATKQAKAAAESASRAKDQFIATLSHELRTPLTPAVAALSLMRSDMRLPSDVREDLEMVSRNIDLEVRLVADLLDVSRTLAGKMHLEKRPTDVANAIREAAKIVSGDLDAKGQTLSIDTPESPYLALADVARLQQVFWNLLRNSIKFSPEKSRIAIRARLVPVEHCPLVAEACPVGLGDCPLHPSHDGNDQPCQGNLVVEVIDRGHGIAPEMLKKLFTPFEQERNECTVGGLGLGLSICKAVVELHGGTIAAHSEGIGRGATFTVRLPVAQCPLSAARTPLASGPNGFAADDQRQGGHTRLRILLVEDHADTAKIMTRVLTAEGHDVVTAGSVADGLAAVARAKPDVLISDLGLPDGSGLDLIKQLLAQGEHIPSIALSGYGTPADIERSKAAGFTEHLVKPLKSVELLTAAMARLGFFGARGP